MPASQPANFNLQEFTDAGQLLVGGRLYTYAYGTTAQKTAFTDPDGVVPHTYTADGAGGQYIALNARGELPAPLYLGAGSYDVMLKRADGSVVWTRKADGVENSLRSWISSMAAAAGATLVSYARNIGGAVKRTLADILDETPSVKDFGLVGDGVTGNGDAIVTMLANLAVGSYELVVPKGDFLVEKNTSIPGNIALRFRAGARFVTPDGVTLTYSNTELKAGRQQIFSCIGTGKVAGVIRNALIYPEWWGFVADGLHPPVGSDFSDRAAAAARNGAALKAAFTFAGYSYALNGLAGTVAANYGQAVYDQTISVPLSVNLFGFAGVGSDWRYYGATGNGIELNGTNNSCIKDMAFAPIAGPTWNFTTGYGVYAKNVSTPIVDNVWSSGFGAGTFYFENVIEGRLRGLISDNSNGPAFSLRGVGQGTTLSNSISAGTQNGACFDIQSGYDWNLSVCVAKDGAAGTNGFYMNACENINLVGCGAHDINREALLMTSSTLNCTITSFFANGASTISAGTYSAMNISGTRNRLIAPKVTQNTPTYSYALVLGGAAIDCTYTEENFTPGTLGSILDAQPTGSNTTKVRKVSTTDATATTVWTKSLNNNAGCTIEATVNMKQRGAAGESASFKVWARAVTGTGGTTIATGTIYSSKSNVASTVNAALVLTNAAANAGVVALQVTGLAGGVATIDWEATVNSVSVTG